MVMNPRNEARSTRRPAAMPGPIASVGGRFPLARPAGEVEHEQPSAPGVRPWNLRRMGPATPTRARPEDARLRYDPFRQVSVDRSEGTVADGTGRAGPPTASTTTKTDGQDPPSAEDWINDFHGDESPWPS